MNYVWNDKKGAGKGRSRGRIRQCEDLRGKMNLLQKLKEACEGVGGGQGPGQPGLGLEGQL